jgi:ZIP Zinc transporter
MSGSAVSSAGGRSKSVTKTRRTLSPLQAKGFWLLAFVAVTESVTLTKAVQFTSTIERTRQGEPRFAERQQREQDSATTNNACTAASTSSSSDDTCSSFKQQQQPQNSPQATTTSGPPVLKRTLGTLGRLKNRFAGGKRRRGRESNNHYYDPHHDCCAEFDVCVAGSPDSLKRCALMRGGHLAGAAATAEALGQAADAAVAAKMPYGIPLNGWKVIFQALLTTLNVVCWLIPLRSKQISENKLALSLANAFSGGVFLSLAFGHLIPECVHGFEGLTNHVTPYLLVLSGYLLIFFIEKVAFDAHEILHEMEHAQDHKATNGLSTPPSAIPADSTMSSSTSSSSAVDPASESNGDVGATTSATSGRSALILLGALAVHSILEMAALGLADTFSDSAILTLSIALHQVRTFK